MKILSLDNLDEKSVYTQLQEQLLIQEKKELAYLKKNAEDIDDFDSLKSEFNQYRQKLAYVLKISDFDNKTQKRYLQVLNSMDSIEGLSDNQKLVMMLSYGVLVNDFKRLHERTDEEIALLAACSSNFDLEDDDYLYYISVLSDANICKAITEKTDDFSSRVDIGYQIMDAQDELPFDYPGVDNFDVFVQNGLDVVNAYELPKIV